MQEKRLFEYAIIRVVPRVEREEFLNAGVILYSKDFKFLDCLHQLDHLRLNAICPGSDCSEVEAHLRSFEAVCKGKRNGGPIATLDLPSRFRWLTATRSTIIQTSKVHPGLTADPASMLQKLQEQFVL